MAVSSFSRAERRDVSNQSLIEAVEAWTPLDRIGDHYAEGACPLPGCEGPEKSFKLVRNAFGAESFRCYSCGRRGDLDDFIEWMEGDPYPLAGRFALAQAIKQGIEPPEELEKSILLKGKVHFLFGEADTGKSWAALWLIKRAIDRGEGVVYFDTENGQRIIAERLGLLGVDAGRVDELLRYYPFPDLSGDPDVVAAYQDLLDEFQPDLVVFDSLANFLGSSGLEESSNDDLIKWAANYTRPARAKGITVVVLDHTGHDGDHERGASRKRDEADVRWLVKCPKPFDRDTVGQLTLRRMKDREAWLPERIRFSVGGSEGRFIFRASDGTIEEPDPVDGLTASARKVLDALCEQFGAKGATASEWRRAAEKPPYKISTPSFWRALKAIKGASLVTLDDSSGDSRYFPKDSPDGGGGGDSEKSRSSSEDSPNYHPLSEDD